MASIKAFKRHLQTGKQSANIEDLRSPFGSSAVDPTYSADDRFADFATGSLLDPYLNGPPQKFRKGIGMSLDDLLTYLQSQGTLPYGVTLDQKYNSGVLK